MRKYLSAFLALLVCLCGTSRCLAASEEKFIIGMVYEGGAAINPLYCNQRDLVSLNELVFESVVTINEQLQPVCELALSYEVSKEHGNEFTFNLRQGISFHDGAIFCALDVCETWQKIKSIGESCPYYTRCSYINRMEAVDLYTLKVTGKYDSLLTMYAMTFPVLQRSSLDTPLPTGTGPYWYIASNTEWIQIDANPYWWKRAPVVDTVEVFRYNETADAMKALSTGEVDAVPTRSQNAALGRLLSDRMSVDYSTLTYEMLIPNLSNEIFSDVRTREAFMYAIDVSTIAQNIYMGMVMKSEVPILTGSWLYEPQSAIYYYSMERAMQLLLDGAFIPAMPLVLLLDAGWGDYNQDGILDKVRDGMLEQLDFTILTCVDDAANTRAHAAELIAEQLKPLGISITVKTVSKDALQKRLKIRDFEMVLCGVNLSVLPDLTFLLNSNGRMNYSGYSSTEMNKLLLNVYSANDEESFKSVMSQIQIKLADLPFLGLFFRKGTLMTTAFVTGLDAIIEGDVLRGFEYIEFQKTK